MHSNGENGGENIIKMGSKVFYLHDSKFFSSGITKLVYISYVGSNVNVYFLVLFDLAPLTVSITV